MSDVQAQAPTPPVSTPPKEGAAPAAPQAQPPPEARPETLESRRQAIKAKLAAGKAAPAGGAQSPPSGESAQQPGEGQQPPKPEDPDAAALAELVREDRRIKAETKRLADDRATWEKERAEHDAEIKRIRAAKDLLAKGDKLGYLRALVDDPEVINTDLYWELVKQIAADPSDSPADVKALVQEELAAREKAAQEAKEKADREASEATQKELVAAAQEYVNTCAAVFEAGRDKYPCIAALGVSAERIQKHVEDHYAKNPGQVPTAQETLQAIEDELAEKVRRTPYAQPGTPPRPAATVTSAWKADPGRPGPGDRSSMTLEERRADAKRRLREAEAARRAAR